MRLVLPYIAIIVIAILIMYLLHNMFGKQLLEMMGTHQFDTSKAITLTKSGHGLRVSTRTCDEFDLMSEYAQRYGKVVAFTRSSQGREFVVNMSAGYSRYGVKRDLAKQYRHFIKELQRLADKENNNNE